MANRHLARSVVLQTLFERDLGVNRAEDPVAALRRNAAEFAPGLADFSFMERLLRGILERQKELDTIVTKAAPDWPIEKVAPVDRNVLRLGLFELLFSDRKEVPAKVAINEAIELAKTFGGESSGKFVNGVLGSVYKEIGEPGKDDNPHTKKKEDVPFDKMPIETLGGAVVYARDGSNVYLALVHDVFGHWTLSKGHLAADEDPKKGMAREVTEEIGVSATPEEELGVNEYVASHPEKGKVRKRVVYFLARAPYQDLKLGNSGGLDDARWFKLSEIVTLNIYDDILPIITKAITLLLKTP